MVGSANQKIESHEFLLRLLQYVGCAEVNLKPPRNLNIERVQRRATKYILNDYTSCYKTRLIKLKLFPLMYLFEIQDILFAIKSIKTQTIQFNITNYISFNSASTRSGANNKLIPPHHLNNTSRHSYFHRLPSLWMTVTTVLYIICAHAQDVTNPDLPPLT